MSEPDDLTLDFTDQDWLRLAASALILFARADSHAYSKMALFSKHLPMDDIASPTSARFAGWLFLGGRKRKQKEGPKADARGVNERVGTARSRSHSE